MVHGQGPATPGERRFPMEQKAIEEQLAFQKRLNAIVHKIHAANDTNEILLNLQDELLSLLDADRITVYAVDAPRKQIVSRFKTGKEVTEIRVPIGVDSIAGYCAAQGRMVNVADAYDEKELAAISPPMHFDRSWDRKTGYRTKQVLVVPILHERHLLGVVQLINKHHGERFTEEDERMVRTIAEVLGIAFLKNERIALRARLSKFEYLVVHNVLSREDLHAAMLKARQSGATMESVLTKEYHVPPSEVGKAISEFYKVPFVAFDPDMSFPEPLLKSLKAGYLRANLFVPIAQTEHTVIVVTDDPQNLHTRDAIGAVIPGLEIEARVSFKEDIQKMIDLAFRVSRGGGGVDSKSIEEILGKLDVQEDIPEEETGGLSEEDSAVVQLVNKMIVDAHTRGASDIHIEPRQGKENASIRFRIDGLCQIYQSIPHTYKKAIVSRIKIMSDLDISERRLPQDGKILFRRFSPLDIELRVATVPTVGQNEDVVIRLLPKGKPLPISEMGMSERNYGAFVEMVSKPYGLVLVVGPTGSGKTTTLHAALAHVNRPELKIWTAEDPVEITQEGLRQVQVFPKIGFDFARAMRAFLRADPDIIMVGEIRDEETASIAVEASLTGHLVLSTLHTNSAPETITRLLDMGMDPFNFGDALLGVLAQRLVRTLCAECKEAYHPSREEYEDVTKAFGRHVDAVGFSYTEDLVLYRPKGCPRCANTGYRKRTGIHELLLCSDKMRAMIQSRARAEALREVAIEEGMRTLYMDGIRKVFLGLTDAEQVRKVCFK